MFNRNDPIYINRNAGFELQFQALNSLGTAINLTGYTVTGAVTRWFGSQEKTALTCAIVTEATGTIKISLTGAQTLALPRDNTVYTVYIQPPAGERQVVKNGPAIITETAI